MGVGETDGLGVGDKLAALVTAGVGCRLKYCWEMGCFSDLDGQGRFQGRLSEVTSSVTLGTQAVLGSSSLACHWLLPLTEGTTTE